MKGYILHTQLVKEEDLIVTILSKNKIFKLYRFYGARHSILNKGYLIDFEIETTNISINRLRNISHIKFDFLFDHNVMLIWQNFIELLYKHLVEIEEISSFYFDILKNIEVNLFRDPKRVIIENYIKLLKFEGRISNLECFLCDKKIGKRVNIVRSYLTACEKCIPQKGFEKEKIEILFQEEKTILLNKSEINSLYKILSLGL